MSRRWVDVLDTQLDVHDFLTSEFGQQFGEMYFGTAFETRDTEDRIAAQTAWTTLGEARSYGARWARDIGVNVFNADPIFVDPDMMTVVESAVTEFRPEPLVIEDLLTPNGFLLLPRPLLADKMPWSAAVWFPYDEKQLHLVLFADRTRAGVSGLLPKLMCNWEFGSRFPARAEIPGMDKTQSVVERQVQGIWRLLQQHLAVPTPERVPKPFRKRAARMDREHVLVVRLRRPPVDRDADDDPRVVNWTHRWIVGGHWRNQPYKSLGITRQIWISPYVKGPAEAPLRVNKARVFALVR